MSRKENIRTEVLPIFEFVNAQTALLLYFWEVVALMGQFCISSKVYFALYDFVYTYGHLWTKNEVRNASNKDCGR